MTTALRRTSDAPRYVRGWEDAALLVLGGALLVLAALPIHAGAVSGAETGVFRAINGVALPLVAVWPFMQLGNLFAAPVAALVAAAFRRWWLAAELLLAGAGVWLLAKQVKRVVERGRPGALLADVHLRGAPTGGLGFVSGHAAVVTALLTVAWPWLNRTWRLVFLALAFAVCLARVQVGAHFPLDVVGGAALGLVVGGAVRLVMGRPG